ncbi:MAG: hypothetical protein E6K63_02990 [Nitrospirae bacterium]|nr:MAG: hypothetical protein E6K63_02990 [Nitrospirota bacterium]
MQVMKEPEIEGVSTKEAAQWLGLSDQELEQLINDGILQVADICDGQNNVVRSVVRTMDIRKLLAKRKG